MAMTCKRILHLPLNEYDLDFLRRYGAMWKSSANANSSINDTDNFSNLGARI